MCNINWSVRVKNPVWWAEVIASIVIPLIVGIGMSWDDMTSWATLGQALVTAVGNPVVVVSMMVSLWNTITDPTTAGVGDSKTAMTYDKPKAE